MKKLKLAVAVFSLGILAAGCTQTGNVERNAAGGAAVGAIIGGIIGNNTGDGNVENGAAVGALLGGAAGAVRGYDQDQRQQGQYGRGNQAQRTGPNGEPLYYDQRAGRYYYTDRYGNSFWQNGQRRS